MEREMNVQQLEARLGALAGDLLPLRPRVTDDPLRLLALGRAYVALFRLVTVTGRDREFGDRRKLIGLGDLLSVCLLRKAGGMTDLPTRSELIAAAFRVTGEVTLSYDIKRENTCRKAVIDLLTAEGVALSDPFALRCLPDYFYPLSEADKGDPWLIALREAIHRWAATLSGAGAWEGLTGEEALLRIEVMARDSALLLDDTCDGAIRRAYAHYRSALSPREIAPLARLRLYDLALRGACCAPDPATAERVLAATRGNRPSGSLWELALEVDALSEALLAQTESGLPIAI